MNVNGEYRIPATRERVWEALHDPETLRACIPGCEALGLVGEGAYEGRIATHVGAVNTVFEGRMTVQESAFPATYTLTGHARSATTGLADGEAAVTLTAEAGGTLLGYRARIELGGRLGSVGNRLLHGLAIRLANEFFSRLIERMAPMPPGKLPQEMAAPSARPRRPVAVQPIAPAPPPAVAPKPSPPAALAQPLDPVAERRRRIKIIVIGLALWLVIAWMLFGPRA